MSLGAEKRQGAWGPDGKAARFGSPLLRCVLFGFRRLGNADGKHGTRAACVATTPARGAGRKSACASPSGRIALRTHLRHAFRVGFRPRSHAVRRRAWRDPGRVLLVVPPRRMRRHRPTTHKRTGRNHPEACARTQTRDAKTNASCEVKRFDDSDEVLGEVRRVRERASTTPSETEGYERLFRDFGKRANRHHLHLFGRSRGAPFRCSGSRGLPGCSRAPPC